MAAALLALMLGGFVFLGFSGFAPWEVRDATSSAALVDNAATGLAGGQAGMTASGDGAATGDGTDGEPDDGSGAEGSGGVGEAAGDQTGSSSRGDAGTAAAADSASALSADEINRLIGNSEASKTATEDFELSVQDAAAELVDRYQAQGDVTLAYAGWLDMFGRCWGCVVVGPGWVEVCLVSGADDASTAQTLRMEVEEWRRIYGRL